jgi:hypothetical protein
MAKGKIMFSTCAPFVFAIQGFLGSLAAGILRAIQDNADGVTFNYDFYGYPFKWLGAG